MFAGPCVTGVTLNYGRGYGGKWYKVAGSSTSTETYGPSTIVVDRRDNSMYFGFNVKTVLPDNNPDFEPAVVAMDSSGDLRWWSRLYHEVQPSGDTVTSTPDQYVDGLAIDYSKPLSTGYLVVNARCHGNNVENLWEGNIIAANTTASGFRNGFSGSNGNIHYSWLGKLKLVNGTLMHSTHVGEYSEGTAAWGTSFTDPNLAPWPNPNSGWPDINTTRIAPSSLKVINDGSVCIISLGRRTITTNNAFQKMVLPKNGDLSCWNQFVRVYTPELKRITYSSLVTGKWDTVTQAGGDNTQLYGVFKVEKGIVVVGKNTATTGVANGNLLPVSNVPTWGQSTPLDESAIFGFFTNDSIIKPGDNPVTTLNYVKAKNNNYFYLECTTQSGIKRICRNYH